MRINHDEIARLKSVFAPLLDQCVFEETEHGQSGARVVRVLTPGKDMAYLKYASGTEGDDIREEHDRMRWLSTHTRIPEVISFTSSFDTTYLLTKALVGRNGADAASGNPATVVTAMAQTLRALHSCSPENCPFDQRVPQQLKLALARVAAGLVDEEDFDEARQGMGAQDVYELLLATVPVTEHLVVTHGDACPENFIFNDDVFVGFIDCGRAGLADRYQDLALASRNIEATFGRELTTLFFNAYGEPNPDHAKLEFYRILDEFF